MTAQTTTKPRPQEDKLSREYRDALLQEARRVSPTDMPQALLDLKEAALRFLDCTKGHKEISKRADALGQIQREIRDLSRLKDADDGIAAAIKKLKVDGGCQQIVTSLAAALAADSRKNRDAILDQCSNSIEALSAQVKGQVISDFLEFNASLNADNVKAVFNNPEHKKGGQLNKIEDVIAKIKQVGLEDIPQLALELAVVINKSANVFQEGISDSTALPKLRKIIKEGTGNLPDFPEHDRSVSLTRFSDQEILEQYILDKLYNDYKDTPQWSQLLSNEISSWSSERLMATSKELLRSKPNNTELRDTVRSLVVMRMSLDSDMVQLADNFHDRWSIKSEVARLKLSLDDYKKDSCDANELAGKERIMKSKKREFIELLKKYVGEDIAIDVRANVEEGKWVYNPKDEPLKILRAAIDEKISSTQARIEALERIRKQQFTSEEALANYANKNNKSADIAEFKRTIQTFLDCGVYRGGDQAKDKMVRWFNAGVASINNPVADQTNETSTREEDDDSSDFEKGFLREDFEIDYDALEFESDTTGPATLYDLACDIRDAFLTTLEDCLTDDLQGESAVTEPLKGLVADIIRDNIKAFIELGTDEAGMLAIDLAQAISHIVKDAEMSSTPKTQDLVDALTREELLPIEATEDFKARVAAFNAEREPQLETLTEKTAYQGDAQTSDSAGEPQGEKSQEGSNGSVDLKERFNQLINRYSQPINIPNELNGMDPQNLKLLAQIVHQGFRHHGQSFPTLSAESIRTFTGLPASPKAFKKAFDTLKRLGVVEESGAGYSLSNNYRALSDVSHQFKTFIDEIKSLRD
jgi:hypothetical protein